jgi:hypothetical protein
VYNRPHVEETYSQFHELPLSLTFDMTFTLYDAIWAHTALIVASEEQLNYGMQEATNVYGLYTTLSILSS